VLPWEKIAEAKAPDGTAMRLDRRGGEWVVRFDGKVLMSSRQHGSEEALAALALGRADRRRRVLIGGMGLGFTLRATLDRLPVDAKVVLAELTPALVDWNRGPLAPLAGRPLDDPRVRVQHGDVLARISESRGIYDAILLDVDNGPSQANAVHAGNERLYGPRGIAACREALADGGVLAVWAMQDDPTYVERLKRAGLEAEVRPAPARGAAGGTRHVIFLGRKPAAGVQKAGSRRPGGKPGAKAGSKALSKPGSQKPGAQKAGSRRPASPKAGPLRGGARPPTRGRQRP
jgi:spermidine synthase